MRKLATIRTINDLKPIEGADTIELATIDNWKVIIKKGLTIGSKIVYFEIDSFLPIRPEFEFLRKSCYKKLADGSEGFSIRTIKLRGIISQGLCIPINELPIIADKKLGDDVSEILGVVKYEPPIPAQLKGVAKGLFPSFLRKTEEERIQNLSNEYKEYLASGLSFYATEKLDGSSATFFIKDGEFGVCSRNLELKETSNNTLWKIARLLNIEEKLKTLSFNACIQGELIGEGIQSNLYHLKGQDVRFFNLFNIDTYNRLPFSELKTFCDKYDLRTVPIVDIVLPDSIDELLLLAEGESKLYKTEREGLVIRSVESTISFKVISNKFLLK